MKTLIIHKPLLNKLYENEVTLRKQNLPLKCFKPLEMQIYFEESFISYNTFDICFVGQRAVKLLAVKFGVLKKKSAALAIPPKACASAFGPGSGTPGVKSFSKFDGQ